MLRDLHRETSDRAMVRIGDMRSDTPFHAGIEYTPPARGTWTIAHTPLLIPNSHMTFVCPDGCLRGVALSAAECHGLDRFSMVSVKEEDLYNGRMEEIFLKGVSEVVSQREDGFSCEMVFTSCIHHLMGIDLKRIFQKLEERFPEIDFVECHMDCTMRKSKLNYEEVQWRQNFRAIKPKEKETHAVNIIGNYFRLDPDSELIRMLEEGGYRVRDFCTMESYEEYLSMGASTYNIYNLPVAKEAADDLSRRLGQESLYLPYSWNPDEIDSSLTMLADKLEIDLPDLEGLRERMERRLRMLADTLVGVEVYIDGLGTPRPMGLARLLASMGIKVNTVYCEAVLPEEKRDFEWMREHAPDVVMSSMVDFRLRLRPRDAASFSHKVLAIGQRAAYFTGTSHFVNLVAQDGLYGYLGIEKLADRIEDAMLHPKDPRLLIQIKAKGCEL